MFYPIPRLDHYGGSGPLSMTEGHIAESPLKGQVKLWVSHTAKAGVVQPEEQMAKVQMSNFYKYLIMESKDGAGICWVMFSIWTRVIGLQLKYKKFCLRELFSTVRMAKYWNCSSRDVVESRFLDTFKTGQCLVLDFSWADHWT